MTEAVYSMIWGQSILPSPSTIKEDIKSLSHQERAFDGTFIVTTRVGDHKHKWVVTWDGADSFDRTGIKDAWKTNWASSTAFRPLDVSRTYNVVSPINGYKEEKRYNHLLGIWRYKITLTVEEV